MTPRTVIGTVAGDSLSGIAFEDVGKWVVRHPHVGLDVLDRSLN